MSEDGASRSRWGKRAEGAGFWIVRTAFSPGLCHCHLDGPALPTDLLITTGQPGLAATLLKELNDELAATTAGGAAVAGGVGITAGGGALGVELALEGGSALLNHDLELVIVDVGEG